MSIRQSLQNLRDNTTYLVLVVLTVAVFAALFFYVAHAILLDDPNTSRREAPSIAAGMLLFVVPALFASVSRGQPLTDYGDFPRWFGRHLATIGLPILAVIVTHVVLLRFRGPGDWYTTFGPFMVGAVLHGICFLSFHDDSPKPLQDELIRGPKLTPFPEVQAKAAKRLSAKDRGLQWGGVRLPAEADGEHFLAAGMTRSGKTVTMNLLMRSVLPRLGDATHARALVYDPKTEVLFDLLSMGVPKDRIVILNPFDVRCSAWNIAADLDEQVAIDEISARLFLKDPGPGKYFEDAAGGFLRGVFNSFVAAWPTERMARVRPTGTWTLRDVLLAVRSVHYLSQILPWDRDQNGAVISNYLNKPRKSVDDVMSTVTNKVTPFEVIAACWAHAQDAGRTFSLNEWVQKEGQVLVLGYSAKATEALAAANRVLVHRLAQLLLSRFEPDPKRSWVFLDELGSLSKTGTIDKLGALLREGRTKGIRVVLGFQDVGALLEAYGQHLTPGLLGQVGNKVMLRLESEEDAKWAQGLFGEVEEKIVTDSQGQSSGEQGPTQNRGQQHSIQRRPLVPFSEFQNIPLADAHSGAGIGGFYRSSALDVAYKYEIPLDALRQLPRAAAKDMETNFQERPRQHQKLLAWSKEELEALGLTPEPKTSSEEKARPDNPPPNNEDEDHDDEDQDEEPLDYDKPA